MLAPQIAGTVEAAAAVPLLRAGRDEAESFSAGIAQAYVHGAPLHAGTFFPGATKTPLPTYPFQREHYWLTADRGDAQFTARIACASGESWMADHVIAGTALVPATAFLELALTAGSRLGVAYLEDLALEAPLPLPSSADLDLRMAVAEPDDAGRRTFTIHARPAGGSGSGSAAGAWARHASGVLAPADDRADETATAASGFGSWPPEGATVVRYDQLVGSASPGVPTKTTARPSPPAAPGAPTTISGALP